MPIPVQECEKIDLKLDIQKLISEIRHLEANFPPQTTVPSTLAWPLMTRAGFKGPMFDGKLPAINGPMDRNPSAADLAPYGVVRTSQDSNLPTSMCQGYFREVIEQLDLLGLWPRGARLNNMKPGCSTIFHRDTVIEQYAVSLHIPVLINSKCYAIINGKRFEMPADGSIYLCNINYKHQFFNDGQTPRYHIVMAAWDTQGISQHFKYQYDYIPKPPSLNWKSLKKVS